ncbi:ATP-binding protein [Prosthecobacter sp. SYSU 5D2]|uniref:ATP-binding protein n=1 Tax=Prosthecobacter sp. SYSU 5D2 TaxID=3134134 RepID=UPI0031FEF628
MSSLVRWLLFTLCLLVFSGAMGWMSLRMLDLEAQRRRTAEEAQVQEKVRLALWRMDSMASALLIRENSRPPHHYQAFYAPEDLFTSRTQSIPKGQALMPSPLFGSLPDLVQLHFERLSGQAALQSPQVPTGSQQTLATSWYDTSPETARAAQKLTALETLLKQHPDIVQTPAKDAPPVTETAPANTLPPLPSLEKQKAATAAADRQMPLDSQVLANSVEQSQRAMVLSNNLYAEKQELAKPQLKKTAPTPPPATAAQSAVAGAKEAPKAAESLAESDPTADEPSIGSSLLAEVRTRYLSRGQKSDTASAMAPASSPAQRQSLPALAGDLRAQWLGQELLLTRPATLDGTARVQGVWVDWPQLQTRLLETVRDLLPGATLQPISPEAARTDAAALVTLPVRLLAGPVAVPLDTRSPLRPALLIAWACLIAASVAIAYVLHRAMLLSERRGAFVSAVTHELRTPLTTFRLYSEMLADDMVPEPAQRRSYLQTLCDESTRLMHLVENVLAYSRIERGRTAGRTEDTQVQSLLDRILPRLRQRTAPAGLELHLDAAPAALAARLRVDAMAVEQILFNLTDNACKYAAPDCDPRRLDLTVEDSHKALRITFRDYGPGLPHAQMKRLFQPFSKSATEAAHSAPGVGLGLALSRQLARELGGDLTHLPVSGRGTAFVLTLKKQDSEK